MKKSFIIFTCVLMLQSLSSAKINQNKLDSLFYLIEKNDKGMGSVSIQKGDREIYHRSYGYSDLKNNKKSDENTKYRIGSISKSFTSVIILKLRDENKLSLNSKLSGYFPSLPKSDKITIEHLLRHESGLFNFTNAEDYTKWMEKPKTKKELLELFRKNGTVFAPGEKAEYSNTNYVLLSWIAEKIEKKDFSEIFKERIIIPLKLKDTYLGGKIDPAKNEARSYFRTAEWEEATETDMSIPWGAGAVVSTPKDINIFYHALFTGKLISADSYEKMTDFKENFGLGLFVFPFYEKKVYGHNGGLDGFHSNAGFFPEDSVFVACLSNAVSMPLNDILIGVMSILFNRDYELPDFKPSYEHTEKKLQSFTGVYSNPQLNMDLTITLQNGTLLGRATGQSAFPLTAYDENKFKFDAAMLKIDFFPESNKLILHQGGQDLHFIKPSR